MKKTYINPEMEIVKIETQQLIATSGPGVGGQYGGGTPEGRLMDDFDDLMDE